MGKLRLTTAQALVKFLDNQYLEVDGVELKFVKGIFAIFGHGNVLGLGQALEQDSGDMRVYQGRNEQGMAHAATGFARQSLRRQIIATGGGIILSEYNRQFMRENGVVIYLQASVSALIDRLEAYPKAEQRPTLTGKPVREEVGEVLAQREALYRDAAHHIVDATASPDRVVEQIMSMLCSATATPVS